ncbi:carbon-nitrogen hydrolase family protein [Dactylosporangium vinaceum]|uniref:Carbon-nitrogen hydrolase family protein n=1 Tax=Dactylosporangium vinaceum TaxID=53362 RepID=A0ABV5M321_9ACTN|nr:carbon-nitrogen hydrolase family protein [Dactylosporangium vinaceum]UAB96361.1 carbon-nitrogen hydrolase family protein [Dactylosporangium vinaceum]
MTGADRIRIAAVQTEVTTDPAVNGRAVRDALRQAADGGARLAHLCEGALSGYVGQDKPHFDGWHIDWAPVHDELHAVTQLAGELGMWVVIGGNHRLTGERWPHNSLWFINDRGELVDRYDKRWCSNTEVTRFYTPGTEVRTFDVDGFRFGCLLCIEVNFPELWLQQQALDVECVLFSTFSEDPIFDVLARGHAAANGFWVSVAVPAQHADAMPSGVIGPHGYRITSAESGQRPAVVCVDLDRTDPDLDIALHKARPWRRVARSGTLYPTAPADDPRSIDRTVI